MTEIWIPETNCEKCSAPMRRGYDAQGARAPQPGDYCVCAKCGDVTVLAEDLTLRALTPEEEEIAATDTRVAPMLRKVRAAIARQKARLN